MDQDQVLMNRALRIYRRSHPTYPAPRRIEIIECTSPSGQKHPVVVLEDVPGLLAAFRIRPCGRLEEVVPFPMKAEVPGHPGRYRSSMLGLPAMPSDRRMESYVEDPARLLANARWKHDQAAQVEDIIKHFTHQLEHLVTQTEDLKRFAEDPSKPEGRRALLSKVKEIYCQIAATGKSKEVLLAHLKQLHEQIQTM